MFASSKAIFVRVTLGLIESEWGQSENNRRAKFYTLTPAGRKRLKQELSAWNRLVEGMTLALGAKAGEA